MTKGEVWVKFRDKQIGLLGAGKENLSLIPFLVTAGAHVTLCERLSEKETIERLEKIPNIQLRLGDDCMSDLGDFDIIFRTPGMPVADVDQALIGCDKQPERTSAVDLFLEHFGNQTIGVTGTKGKGTTSTMIASILKAASIDVIIAGNIGNSIFESLDYLNEQTLIVMELSSFQLEDIRHSPHIAVIVPIVPDHLQPLSERSPNYHRSFEDYVEAKKQLIANQSSEDIIVYASDNEATSTMVQSSEGLKFGVGRNGPEAILADGVLNFQSQLIDIFSTNLRGDHIFMDAALSAVTAILLKVDTAEILQGLKEFKPLPHRMEKIGNFNGITVVNDSYATAPDATIAAISAFSEPIILLAGGSSKGADFSELSKVIVNNNIKAVVLIGQESNKIQEALNSAHYDGQINMSNDLEQAVKSISQIAKTGDVVLLSPACASKDMFVDAADRGTKFTELVRQYFA